MNTTTTRTDNSKMRAGRFERWARYRRAEAEIKAALASGRKARIATYAVVIPIHDTEDVRSTETGLFVRRGSKWQRVSCLETVQISK